MSRVRATFHFIFSVKTKTKTVNGGAQSVKKASLVIDNIDIDHT